MRWSTKPENWSASSSMDGREPPACSVWPWRWWPSSWARIETCDQSELVRVRTARMNSWL